MNIRILITLLFGVTLFCSCQPKQLPVNSLAERVTEGTSKDRILFRMTPEKDDVSKDYFEITAEDGKVLIVGNSDLSLATGLNWYLKYVAGIFPGITRHRSCRKCSLFPRGKSVRRQLCKTVII